MYLLLNKDLAQGYKSQSQIARRVTEDWGEKHLYCVACTSNQLDPCRNNNPAVDLICPQCHQNFQLKSRLGWSNTRVTDAGYEQMMKAVTSDNVPNLLVMQYTLEWEVKNLLLIPSFFFSSSAIQKRNPLSPTARRANYVGCNILLSAIASEGKIHVVSNGVAANRQIIRDEYQHLKPLSAFPSEQRGWTLDVLNIVSRFGERTFHLSDVYNEERHLEALHPNNLHIKAKIRQQLQILRDLNLLRFLGNGKYQILQN